MRGSICPGIIRLFSGFVTGDGKIGKSLAAYRIIYPSIDSD
jgi:hypothetical protein